MAEPLAAEIASFREEIRSEFKRLDRRLRSIEGTTKKSSRKTDDIADTVSWNALFQDVILCGICLGASFGMVLLDKTVTGFCGFPGMNNLPMCQPKAAPTANQTSQLQALRMAIVGQESNGDHAVTNTSSGALGLGQVMPENLTNWSKEAVGRTVTKAEFLEDKSLQLQVIDHKLAEYLNTARGKTRNESEQVKLVACWWYAGPGGNCGSTSLQAGGYPSIASYSEQVLQRYQAIPKGKGNSGVVAIAQRRVGSHFRAGISAQCAEFVRDVYKEAGIALPVTRAPLDGHTPNPSTANSLAGADLGAVIQSQNRLQPGDLVFWANTYGDYPPGTITHIGIYVGGGQVVDRPTLEGTVKQRAIAAVGGRFYGGVRLSRQTQP